MATSKKAPKKSNAAGAGKKGEAPKVKKTSKTKKTKEEPSKKPAQVAQVGDSESEAKGIIIEACKQCNAFKTRALKLQTLLTEGKSGLSVTINPEKPRKGCFEVRNTESGEKYVSLLNMPRPFPPLKALDIDDLGNTILTKLD